jgi:membrane-associated phospholipid phosphatase
MENLTDLGLQIITWFQGLGSWLTLPLKFFSFTGVEQFYLLVAPALYWCVDAGLGLKLGIFLLVNSDINSYLKFIFHSGRPFWITDSIKPLAFESTFSMPSGHAQNAMVHTSAKDGFGQWQFSSS